MQKNPSPYIHHIIDASAQITEYLDSVKEGEFKNNEMLQDAVIRNLEIIGEACSKLEDTFKKDRPNIPWKEIVGMRNRLAHEYWDIDLEVIWQTVTKDVPRLQKQLLELEASIGK
jgi:uncharacterized protein with HEPN domain